MFLEVINNLFITCKVSKFFKRLLYFVCKKWLMFIV